MNWRQDDKLKWKSALENDDLDQKDLLEHLVRLIVNNAKKQTPARSARIFIDAPWGWGKSAFFELLGHILNGRYLEENDFFEPQFLSGEERRILHGISAFSFNAAELEILDLPEYELVLEIIGAVSQEIGFSVASGKIEKIAQDLGYLIDQINEKRFVPEVLKSPLHPVNLASDMLTGTKIKEQLNSTIDEIVAVNAYPLLVIMIDDLDKCQRSTAVRLLEFCDLFWDNPNLFFIFAGDKEILVQNIQALYSPQFPALQYLECHVGRFYKLKAPGGPGYCRHLFGVFAIDDGLLLQATQAMVAYYDLDPNQTRRLVGELALHVGYFPLREGGAPGYVFGKYFLMVWLLVLKIKSGDLLDQFLLGEYSQAEIIALFESDRDYLEALKTGCCFETKTDEEFFATACRWYPEFLAASFDPRLYLGILTDPNAAGIEAFGGRIAKIQTDSFNDFDGGALLKSLYYK